MGEHSFIKRILRQPRTIRTIDRVNAVGLRVCSPPIALFNRMGSTQLPRSAKVFKKLGYYPMPDHWSYPMFNDDHLRHPLSDVRSLPGVDLNLAGQVEFVQQLNYADEIRQLRWGIPQSNATQFSIENQMFMAGDAEFLYSMVRHAKPKRVIEIGSGNSTLVASEALRRNRADDGLDFEHICVEPYREPWLEELEVTVVRERVEVLGADFFSRLEAGDLLFIDSSHVIRPQGDVLFEFLELLPQLASGVIVHVHDIFTPRDYPDAWIRTRMAMSNEQYLVEALLSNSTRYEVVAALNYLAHEEFEQLASVCPHLQPGDEPRSLYLRVR